MRAVSFAFTLLLMCSAATDLAAKAPGAHDRIYVTNERDGKITVIDADADTVIGSFMVGGRPRGIRATPDCRALYVAVSKPTSLPKERAKEYDFVVKVEISGSAPLDAKVTRLYSAGSDPEQIDLTHDGKHFIVANEDAGTASIVDLSSGKILAELVAGLEPEGVRVAPTGGYAYVTSEAGNTISVIDVASKTIVKSFLVGSRPRDVAFCSKHHKAFITNEHSSDISVVDTRSHSVIHTIPLCKGALPMCAQTSPDGERIYISTGRGNSVSVIDCEKDSVSATILTGHRTWGIALNKSGTKLYAANSLDNTVSIIDTKTLQVLRTLKVGDGPWGVVYVGR
jgi:YVTN family beta-propeller protein